MASPVPFNAAVDAGFGHWVWVRLATGYWIRATGNWQLIHGKHSRHTAPYPQRGEHAADYQGHESGLSRQVAPRPGAHDGRAPLCADVDECAEIAGGACRDLRS